jgi:hypothetical protein
MVNGEFKKFFNLIIHHSPFTINLLLILTFLCGKLKFVFFLKI